MVIWLLFFTFMAFNPQYAYRYRKTAEKGTSDTSEVHSSQRFTDFPYIYILLLHLLILVITKLFFKFYFIIPETYRTKG